MQQARHHRRDVHPLPREDRGHLERVGNVGLAARAQLVSVELVREHEGVPHLARVLSGRGLALERLEQRRDALTYGAGRAAAF